MSCSGNYRQLQLLRGVRGVEETEEEKRERDMTRSEAQVMTPRDIRGQDDVLLIFMFRSGTEEGVLTQWSRRRRLRVWPAPGSSSP